MGQEISLPSEAGGWKWDGDQKSYNSRTVFDYIDGAAELFLAYGFKNLTVRKFEKPEQPPIMAEVYEMASPADAYGVFSFERQDEDARIGQGSEFGGGLLRFWKGVFFVSVYAEGEGAGVEPAVLAVGRAVADSIKSTGAEPELIRYIPSTGAGLVPKSVRFLRSHILLNQRFFVSHQNILHLGPNTEAVLAQFLRNQHKVHLLLVRYPTKKEAESARQSFVKAYMPEAAGRDRLRIEDRKWTFAKGQGKFLLILFGAPDEADGESLIKAVEEKLGRR